MKNFRFELIGSTVEADGEEEEDEVPAGGGSNTNPEPGGSSGGSQTTPTLYEVTYKGPNDEVFATQQYEVGQQIVPPEPPAGYIWNYHPNYMPAENLTVDCLEDE